MKVPSNHRRSHFRRSSGVGLDVFDHFIEVGAVLVEISFVRGEEARRGIERFDLFNTFDLFGWFVRG